MAKKDKKIDKSKTVQLGLYKRIFNDIAKPQMKLIILSILAMLVAAGAEAYSITLVKRVVDEGFFSKNMDILYIVGLQIIAAYATKGLFGYLNTMFMGRAGANAATYLRKRLFRQMMCLDMGFFFNKPIGRLMNYYTVEAGAVLNVSTKVIVDVIKDAVTVLAMVGMMIYYAPHMLGVIVILAPAILIPFVIITRKMRKVTRKTFGLAAESSSHINQSLQGIKTIQSYNREELETKKMYDIEASTVKTNVKSINLSGLRTPILEVLISLGLAGSLLLGGKFISSGVMTTGDFVAFILAMTAAYKPLKSLTRINGAVQSGLIAAESIYEFLDMKPKIRNAKNAIELKRGKLSVEFDHVNFAYNEIDGDVLHDINLNVKPGQVCAFVGPSGGGKSTMVNLITRFYDVNSGAIKINKHDIREYTVDSLRESIAEVSQDVFLFSGTIADNIKYGDLSATQKEIQAAAKLANAHDFISEFPEGYNTVIGERGARLSGGQRQRIAIARALLKNAPILLLDEATSALDTQSERLIQTALEKLMVGRTTFVIAHRLSTILGADMICVIKNGQIVEQGNHSQLMKKRGMYKKLYDVQFAENN